jgi:hypothetical protein
VKISILKGAHESFQPWIQARRSVEGQSNAGARGQLSVCGERPRSVRFTPL